VSVWLLEPRDPLVARDGRPAGTGGMLSTLPFPYPSTLAGAVRTRLAAGGGTFDLTPEQARELLAIEIRGPLLAELTAEDSPAGFAGSAGSDNAGAAVSWFAPAPRDALFVQTAAGALLKRLRPAPAPAGCAVDSLGDKGLQPVTYAGATVDGKPPAELPAFWSWKVFEEWLATPGDRGLVNPAGLGLPPLPVERRVHVSLEPGQRVGAEGMLFQTAGLRFLAESGERLAPRRLALSVDWEGAEDVGRKLGRDLALAEQLAPLGGERRLARWSRSGRAWPEMPEKVETAIAATARARLILLTPAVFAQGALPGWNGAPLPGPGGAAIRARVRAACVARPEIVSGWDLAAGNEPGKAKGQPKPTRRLAPAGSVYFLELTRAGGGAELTTGEIAAWCRAAWLRPVSDAEQDRCDGFGLAVLGTWEEET
jgi:CRISPR-associated protein Cmr3